MQWRVDLAVKAKVKHVLAVCNWPHCYGITRC